MKTTTPRNHDQAPGWIREGVLVDYRTVPGGPITRASVKVLGEPWRLKTGGWVCTLQRVPGAVAVETLSLPQDFPGDRL